VILVGDGGDDEHEGGEPGQIDVVAVFQRRSGERQRRPVHRQHPEGEPEEKEKAVSCVTP
jgi:hypothetical protein